MSQEPGDGTPRSDRDAPDPGWNDTTPVPVQHDTTPLPTHEPGRDEPAHQSPHESRRESPGWGEVRRPEPLGPPDRQEHPIWGMGTPPVPASGQPAGTPFGAAPFGATGATSGAPHSAQWGPPTGPASVFPPPPGYGQGPPGYLAAPPAPARRGRGRRALGVVALVVAALLAGILGGAFGDRLLDDVEGEQIAIPLPSGSTERSDDSVAGVAARVLPSTVSIEVAAPGLQGSGSGFVLREDGLIVTNNHVVADAADAAGEIRVTFSDGTQELAEVVGRTVDYDIAVLRVDRDGLAPLPFGDSDSVVVGDPVIAVGAPLGLEATVTSGIVSALNRPVVAGDSDENAFINAIQTDAAINPGNSGGPLVNAVGEVIGVNSAIARNPGSGSGPSGSIGLGFAIPSAQVARTAEQLIETGRATYPVIGVLLDNSYTGEGVKVAEEADQPPVVPGGPADQAGIQAGDVITGFNGRPVTAPDELIVGIRALVPGDTVRLTVRTGDDEREVEVVLDEEESN